jgi:hypothetical protein
LQCLIQFPEIPAHGENNAFAHPSHYEACIIFTHLSTATLATIFVDKLSFNVFLYLTVLEG